MRPVDFDRRVEQFDGAYALACCEQCTAPVLKGGGFLPRQTVALEGCNRFPESGFCPIVIALRRSNNRLGALDAACEPTPVLAGADDLAATLKMRQCFAGVAGVRSHGGERGPGEQFV